MSNGTVDTLTGIIPIAVMGGVTVGITRMAMDMAQPRQPARRRKAARRGSRQARRGLPGFGPMDPRIL
jgi:hypothetical protein